MNPIFVKSENFLIRRKRNRTKRRNGCKKREAPRNTRKLKKPTSEIRESRSRKRSSAKRDSRGDEAIRSVLLQDVRFYCNKSRTDTSPNLEMHSEVHYSMQIINEVDNLDLYSINQHMHMKEVIII